jgi:AraC family transcriptional regulator, transcriptional activator of pobA
VYFTGQSYEYLRLATIDATNRALLYETFSKAVTLMVLWNTEEALDLKIDDVPFRLGRDQLVFLTEFHRVEVGELQQCRMVRFNRAFFCIIDHDSEVGCKGILFFGASQVPVLTIPASEKEKFELLWRMFSLEMQSRDTLQLEMLQMMLKRFLILCTRLYKVQRYASELSASPDVGPVDVVREYSFLVEMHFRQRHTVAEYAALLHKSPKTVSNIFAQLSPRTPLQIIQDRLLLEARRLLHYTDRPLKDIAHELGYEDIQTFSRFFKAQEQISPSEYREKRRAGTIANTSGQIA